MARECGKTAKIPDVTLARRERVNLHGSIPERRDEEEEELTEMVEKEDDEEKERKREREHRREPRENAGARGARFKYLTDAATKRPEQTTNKQTKTDIRRLHGACPREARSDVTIFEFSGLSDFAATWRKVKRERGRDVNCTLPFLDRRSDADRLRCATSRE